MIDANLNYIDALLAPLCMIPENELDRVPFNCQDDEVCMRSLIRRYCVPGVSVWGSGAKEGLRIALVYLLSMTDKEELGRILRELFEQPYLAIRHPTNIESFVWWFWDELYPETYFQPSNPQYFTQVKLPVNLRT